MARTTTPLTDTACRNAKSEPGKQRKLFDGEGLFLLVQPNGSKLWRLKYRFAGREKLLALGAYPTVSLAAARKAKSEARQLLTDGLDPSTTRRLNQAQALAEAANTLEGAAEEWFKRKQTEWAPGHASKVWLRLKKNVFPFLGHRPISQVTTAELLAVLRKMEDRQALDLAKRVRLAVSGIYRYAVATGLAERDIARDLVGVTASPIKRGHASIADAKTLARLLIDIHNYEGAATTKAALKLAPMLFVRPGELRGMRWSEIDFEKRQWIIPPERQKLRQNAKRSRETPDFIVPLPTQAMEILEELRGCRRASDFVFPSTRSPDRSMSDGTINAALRRLGYEKHEITGHGFRHTASTFLNEQEIWGGDVIEAQLSHRDKNSIRGVYNRSKYLPKRIEMMQAWADYLDQLRNRRLGAGTDL